MAELLVVVAIIGILAGMLLPVVGMVFNDARRTACMSNLRQVGMAGIVYAGNWDGQLPAEGNLGIEDPARSPAWFHRLPELLDAAAGTRPKRSVFQCAAYRWTGPQVFTNASPKSYKMNSYLDNAGRPRHTALGMPGQSRLVWFVDALAGETGMGQWGHCVATAVTDGRHPRSAVVLHLDGHAISQVARRGGPESWRTALTWLPEGWPGGP